MSNHTPEPRSNTLGCVTSIDRHVSSCVGIVREANASRIVACVNACAGMEDPAAEIDELKRQRDELLEALNMARDYIVCCTCGGPALVGLAQVIDELLDNTEGTK